MRIWENEAILAEALPWFDCADYLRLRRDENGDVHQPHALEAAMRTASAIIDQQTGRQWLQREMAIETERLPIELPVHHNDVPTMIEALRDAVIAKVAIEVLRDKVAVTSDDGGQGDWRIIFAIGRDWQDLPADIRQAMIIMAAYHFRNRDDGEMAMPNIQALIAPYRKLRLGRR